MEMRVPDKGAVGEAERKAAHWRAHHRGTREADRMVGGFADRWLATMDAAEFGWFCEILEEQDVDIMAWAFGVQEPPERLRGPMMDRLVALDYVRVDR